MKILISADHKVYQLYYKNNQIERKLIEHNENSQTFIIDKYDKNIVIEKIIQNLQEHYATSTDNIKLMLTTENLTLNNKDNVEFRCLLSNDDITSAILVDVDNTYYDNWKNNSVNTSLFENVFEFNVSEIKDKKILVKPTHNKDLFIYYVLNSNLIEPKLIHAITFQEFINLLIIELNLTTNDVDIQLNDGNIVLKSTTGTMEYIVAVYKKIDISNGILEFEINQWHTNQNSTNTNP